MHFIIDAMHCDGCARGVTRAVQRVDATAQITIDIPSRRVDVSSTADSASIAAALDAAGFPPRQA